MDMLYNYQNHFRYCHYACLIPHLSNNCLHNSITSNVHTSEAKPHCQRGQVLCRSETAIKLLRSQRTTHFERLQLVYWDDILMVLNVPNKLWK